MAETQIRHSEEQSFPLWLFMGEILLGAALTAQGQAQRGVPLMQSSLDKLLTIGMKSANAFWFSVLVESCLEAEDIDGAAEAFEKMTESLNPGEEPFFEAEVHRLRGEVELRKQAVRDKGQRAKGQAEAEASFQQALTIARREHVKSLELRAAISLCRLWQQQNKTSEAHAQLSEIYDWFTEGSETGDFTQAQTLLQELQVH